MADVKWIKITTDIFDDEKILLIESLPDADAIIVIWFKLLCLAGKQNNSGVFIMGSIPYTDNMLATIFRRKESTVKLALQTFEQFGMIELIDGVITIPNWGKHQNLEQIQARKEYQKEYQREYREKQKLLADGENSRKHLHKHLCNDDVNTLEGDIEEEIEEEKEKNRIECVDYKSIVDLFNQLCPSFPTVKSISDARKKAIKARLNSYTIDDFRTMFIKAEASSFLKGANNRNWMASFDWLIKDSNMAKVLDGNYDDKINEKPVNETPKAQTITKSSVNFTEREFDGDKIARELFGRHR